MSFARFAWEYSHFQSALVSFDKLFVWTRFFHTLRHVWFISFRLLVRLGRTKCFRPNCRNWLCVWHRPVTARSINMLRKDTPKLCTSILVLRECFSHASYSIVVT